MNVFAVPSRLTDKAEPASPAAIVDVAPELGAFPVVAQRALLLLRLPDPPLDDIADLIGQDQALAAALLTAVNSGLAMANRRIVNVREAIVRVGARPLWGILTEVASLGTLDRGLPPYSLSRAVAWRHAATAGQAARLVARRACPTLVDTASVAGLLHDVGKSLMASVVPSTVFGATTRARSLGLSVAEGEQLVLGFDHGDVGGAFLDRLGLPPEVARAVAQHHCPGALGDRLSAVVHVADVVAHRAGAVGGAGACAPSRLDPTALDCLGLTEADVDVLAASPHLEPPAAGRMSQR